MSDPRVAAARALAQVLGGRSLSDALPAALAALAARDRPLAQELAYGSLRRLPRLEALTARLLRHPLKAKDRDVHALVLIGLYQLGYLAVPAHAAVSETVAAAGRLGKGWARGMLNAVLRRYGREREHLDAAVDAQESARFSHPQWLLDALRDAWPAQWPAILAANDEHPPMTLRVNRARLSRDAYRAELQDAGIAAGVHPHAADALVLERPQAVEALPGFDAGLVSVQDAAAQLAATLLDPAPGERVLDACAAPGGKTLHLLEHCPDCRVTALDRDPQRLARVRENLSRAALQADVVAGDAGTPDAWWDGVPFDRILLDAPCSATGVIRRHPDIKLLRRADDIPALAAEQARLLHRTWPLLKAGGLLVYATCSVLPQEGRDVVAAFLASQADAAERPITAAWGHPVGPGRQILPGEDAMDGFYYACLTKG